MTRVWAGILLAVALAWPLTGQPSLRIYWIDVEGGAATLIVTPEGETVLMDAGWPGFEGRDAGRIVRVLKGEIGATRLDYFISSHFHRDHTGGLAALAERVEIGKFVDHGDSVEIGWNERADQLWESYLAAAGDRRMRVEPGQRLPLASTDFLIVAARSRFIDAPIGNDGPNPHCRDATSKTVDKGENGKSIGFLIRVGDFEFLDLGDLSWNFENETACPVNLFGEVDLYQVTHHGMHMSGAPAHVRSIKPLVAVMNNGPRKGGSPATYELLTSVPSLQDLWQVHRSVEGGDSHNPDEQLVANLGETEGCEGHWLRAAVQPDGSFTITNSRNDFSKSYKRQ